MLKKLKTATKPFRKRFGFIQGTSLWFSLLKEKITVPGQTFSIRVPGVKKPIHLRAKTSDIEAFCQIFVHGELDIKIEQSVNYIIDAGANIGLSSIWFANQFPDALIDSLEIDNNNIFSLQLNSKDYPNINIVPKGLWSCSTTLRIVNPDAEPWAFRVETTDDTDPLGFPATTIFELMKAREAKQIDILKIDIEGAEKEVFEADTSWLSNVGTLFIELHDRLKPDCSRIVFDACSKYKHKKVVSGEYNVLFFLHNIC
jgi:FkbM family methyltransferase